MKRNMIAIRSLLVLICLTVVATSACSIEHPDEVASAVNEFNASSTDRYSAQIRNEYYEIDIHDLEGVVDTVLYKEFLVRLTRVSKQEYLVNVFDSQGKLDHVQYAIKSEQDTTYAMVKHYEY